MLQSCLSSFQNVLILDLEMLGSKVMNKNVRQGFCCWRKSLIFCRGIFCMKKLPFFFNNVLENTSNHLKIGINHPQNGFKKILKRIFEIFIFRDFTPLKVKKWHFFVFFALRLCSGGHKIVKNSKYQKFALGSCLKYPKDHFQKFLDDFKHFSGSY